MNPDTKSLLEVDPIDEVLESPAPPPPVVMIQYRARRLPWILLSGLLLVLPMGGFAAYHQLMPLLRNQARFAARAELERLEEQRRIKADDARRSAVKPPAEPASPPSPPSPSPVLAGNEGTAVVGPAVSAALKPPVAVADSRSTGPIPARGAPAVPPTATASAAAVSPAPTRLDPPAVKTSQATVDESQSPFAELMPEGPGLVRPSLEPPGPSPAPSAGPSPGSRSSAAAAPAPVVSDAPVKKPAELAVLSAVSPSPTSPPVVAPALPALPSKEEFLRQSQAEADQKAAEIAHQQDEKLDEVRRLMYEERVRFHKEIRDAVAMSSSLAGPAIDQLCQRYDYKSDPERFALAHRVWRSKSGRPLASRVRSIRALDLPEVVILNFISADLDPLLRTRGGPRNRNELRIWAARSLLKTGLTSFEKTNQPRAAVGQTSQRGNQQPGIATRRPAAGSP